MLSFLASLKELVVILWPIIQKILQAVKDSEVRAISQELRDAKTVEEKREAARKIADALYKS